MTHKGIDNHLNTYRKKTKCFYINLNNLDYKVGVKRWFKGYKNLSFSINIGDTLTINYFDTYLPYENINTDLVQVKKQKVLIFKKR